MQIIDLRAERGGNGQYFGRIRSCACRRMWQRGRAYALAPRAIVATAARRGTPPSPICELGRDARGAANRIHSGAEHYSIRRRAQNVRGRWQAKVPSLSGAATATLGRRAPPSSICELGRCGQPRHRLVMVAAPIVLAHR